jgi:hypothetical protein
MSPLSILKRGLTGSAASRCALSLSRAHLRSQASAGAVLSLSKGSALTHLPQVAQLGTD